MHRRDTVVQLPKFTPFDTAVNRLPQSPKYSLIVSAEDPSHRLPSTMTAVGQFPDRFRKQFFGHLIT